MKEVLRYPNCFVCGEKNIGGLKAKFFFDGEKAFTEVSADEQFEGYKGIYHGGVISSLLDEVMIKAILALDKFVVTAELTIKYKQPVKIGTKLVFKGWLTRQKGRLYLTEGSACGEDGEVYATATAKYVEAASDLKSTLLKSSS